MSPSFVPRFPTVQWWNFSIAMSGEPENESNWVLSIPIPPHRTARSQLLRLQKQFRDELAKYVFFNTLPPPPSLNSWEWEARLCAWLPILIAALSGYCIPFSAHFPRHLIVLLAWDYWTYRFYMQPLFKHVNQRVSLGDWAWYQYH